MIVCPSVVLVLVLVLVLVVITIIMVATAGVEVDVLYTEGYILRCNTYLGWQKSRMLLYSAVL